MTQIAELVEKLENTSHCRQLLEAWLLWRGDKLTPEHTDVRPELLRSTMAAISVLDYQSPELATFRITSHPGKILLGRDPIGENYIDLASRDTRAERIKRYQSIIERPCGMFTTGITHPHNKPAYKSFALNLPIKSASADRFDQVYIAVEYVGPIKWEDNIDSTDLPLAEDLHYIDIGNGIPD